MSLRSCLPLLAALAIAGPAHAAAPPGAERCVIAAKVFVEGLVPSQRPRVVVPWGHKARLAPLHPPGIAPGASGIRIAELAEGQRIRLYDFLSCSMSSQGFQKVLGIIRRADLVTESFKAVPVPQRETRAETGSQSFWITLFGEPSLDKPFAWRLEGHHLAVNFSIERGQLVAGPQWLAVDPAVMTKTQWAGFRVLDTEFTRGLELLESLTAAQQKRAVVAARLPQQMRLTPDAKSPPPVAAGLPLSAMNATQQRLFQRLVDEYVGNVESGAADALRDRIAAADPAKVFFAWEGPTARGQPVYYRVQTPVLDIEFSHALDVSGPQKGFDINHIHTWWQARPGGAAAAR